MTDSNLLAIMELIRYNTRPVKNGTKPVLKQCALF